VSFTDVIDRPRADALIPTELAREVIKATAEESVAMSLCRRAVMSTKTYTQPVLSALVQAYWVRPSDTGLKQTSVPDWEGITLTAEEVAVIVPVPQAVFDDAAVNIWVELRPEIAAAFARKIDTAVLTGADKPASWPTALVPGAAAAGNVVTAESPAGEGGVYQDLEEAIGIVEDDGYDPSAIAASGRLKRRLRRARNELGNLLGEGSTQAAWDLPISYSPTALPAPSIAVVGDWAMAVLGTRADLSYEVFREGVINDDTGKITINLMQQDMVALRCVGRFGFAVATPATATEGDAADDRYPFAVVREPTPPATAAAPAEPAETGEMGAGEQRPRRAAGKR
jgi:HK97 family phage major capsid protein